MKPYEQAVRYAGASGLNFLSNYMLYNFHDKPSDLVKRLRINVTLNEELGTKIYSFLCVSNLLIDLIGDILVNIGISIIYAIQIILQATHGIVSGAQNF